MNNIFKKYKADRVKALEESISRTNTILIHWKAVPYNSPITYISNNITLLGYSVLECVKNNNIILDIRNIGETIFLQRKIQGFLRNEYKEFEHSFKAKTKDGEDVWLNECTRVIYKNNKIAYGETLLLDITKEKKFQEKIVSSIESPKGNDDDQREENLFSGNIMDKFMPADALQSFQDIFLQMNKCIGLCVDVSDEPVTRLSGNDLVLEILKKNLGLSEIHRIVYEMVLKVTAENMEVWKDTEYDNVKVAALPLFFDSSLCGIWVLFFILNEVEVGGKNLEVQYEYFLKEEQVKKVLHILDLFSQSVLKTVHYHFKYAMEARKRLFAENSMEEEKRRNEIFAYIIQLLDSEQDFDSIVYLLLEIVGKYLDLNNAVIFKTGRIEDFEVVAEWFTNERYSYRKFSAGASFFEHLNMDVVVISENDDAGNYRKLMGHSAAVSMLSVPIIINNSPAMMAVFFDNKPGRNWDILTISFITDICRMLQSIIYRRISKNSLMSSYSALKEILDNIGSIIYVVDKETKQILFCNELFKKTCKQDMVGKYCWDYHYDGKWQGCDNCVSLKDSSSFVEYCDEKNGYWSEISNNDITWVDGRLVSLCVITDITDKKKYQNKIEFQANNDFLTGLYNRMRCEQDLLTAIAEAEEANRNGAVLFIDLDDFKCINDGLGHQYGDLLLKEVSASLRQIRGVSERCYRLGGDEFLIIVPYQEIQNLQNILNSIKDLFDKPWWLDGEECYCTMSMGIVFFPKDGKDVGDLVKKADMAMYNAKKSGKNRYAYGGNDESID